MAPKKRKGRGRRRAQPDDVTDGDRRDRRRIRKLAKRAKRAKRGRKPKLRDVNSLPTARYDDVAMTTNATAPTAEALKSTSSSAPAAAAAAPGEPVFDNNNSMTSSDELVHAHPDISSESVKRSPYVLDVTCGDNEAILFMKGLSTGSKGACVLFERNWLTPNEFQYVSGRESAKDWKRSIKHHGKSLKILVSRGLMCLKQRRCKCYTCEGRDRDDVSNDRSGSASGAETKSGSPEAEFAARDVGKNENDACAAAKNDFYNNTSQQQLQHSQQQVASMLRTFTSPQGYTASCTTDGSHVEFSDSISRKDQKPTGGSDLEKAISVSSKAETHDTDRTGSPYVISQPTSDVSMSPVTLSRSYELYGGMTSEGDDNSGSDTVSDLQSDRQRKHGRPSKKNKKRAHALGLAEVDGVRTKAAKMDPELDRYGSSSSSSGSSDESKFSDSSCDAQSIQSGCSPTKQLEVAAGESVGQPPAMANHEKRDGPIQDRQTDAQSGSSIRDGGAVQNASTPSLSHLNSRHNDSLPTSSADDSDGGVSSNRQATPKHNSVKKACRLLSIIDGLKSAPKDGASKRSSSPIAVLPSTSTESPQTVHKSRKDTVPVQYNSQSKQYQLKSTDDTEEDGLVGVDCQPTSGKPAGCRPETRADRSVGPKEGGVPSSASSATGRAGRAESRAPSLDMRNALPIPLIAPFPLTSPYGMSIPPSLYTSMIQNGVPLEWQLALMNNQLGPSELALLTSAMVHQSAMIQTKSGKKEARGGGTDSAARSSSGSKHKANQQGHVSNGKASQRHARSSNAGKANAVQSGSLHPAFAGIVPAHKSYREALSQRALASVQKSGSSRTGGPSLSWADLRGHESDILASASCSGSDQRALNPLDLTKKSAPPEDTGVKQLAPSKQLDNQRLDPAAQSEPACQPLDLSVRK